MSNRHLGRRSADTRVVAPAGTRNDRRCRPRMRIGQGELVQATTQTNMSGAVAEPSRPRVGNADGLTIVHLAVGPITILPTRVIRTFAGIAPEAARCSPKPAHHLALPRIAHRHGDPSTLAHPSQADANRAIRVWSHFLLPQRTGSRRPKEARPTNDNHLWIATRVAVVPNVPDYHRREQLADSHHPRSQACCSEHDSNSNLIVPVDETPPTT